MPSSLSSTLFTLGSAYYNPVGLKMSNSQEQRDQLRRLKEKEAEAAASYGRMSSETTYALPRYEEKDPRTSPSYRQPSPPKPSSSSSATSKMSSVFDKAKARISSSGSTSNQKYLSADEAEYERLAKEKKKQERKAEYERLDLGNKTKYGMGGMQFN